MKRFLLLFILLFAAPAWSFGFGESSPSPLLALNKVNSRVVTDLSAASTDPSLVGKTAIVSSAVTVSSDLTWPSDRSLTVVRGGLISVSSGKTLIISGPFSAGDYQVFTGSGAVVGLKEVRPEWWGAKGDGVTDDSKAIQAALDVGVKTRFRIGIYAVETPLSVTQINTSLVGDTKGAVGANVVIKYTGTATASAVITVQNGKHGFQIDGFDINANLLADIGLHVVANAGSSTHHPVINNVIVRGYNTRGIVLGVNTLLASNGQMQMVQMNRVYWQGGTNNAIGLLLNAQNCEFVVGNGWYFDIDPLTYSPHSNHIRAVAGGISIQSLLSTRANSYAILSNGSQVIVDGWRSEDGWLFQTSSVELEGPCSISNLQSRATPVSMPQPVATDPTIDFNGINSTLILSGISTQCSIRIGATSSRNVVATGIDFRDASAGFLYSGPSNRSGIFHRLDTGVFDLCGSSPALLLKDQTGAVRTGVEVGGLRQSPNSLAQITTNQSSLAADGYSFFRLTNNGAHDIYGVGTPVNGRRITFVNMSEGIITFKHLSPLSTPSTWQMRSNTGSDIELSQFEMIEMIYDGLSSMWRMWKL